MGVRKARLRRRPNGFTTVYHVLDAGEVAVSHHEYWSEIELTRLLTRLDQTRDKLAAAIERRRQRLSKPVQHVDVRAA